MKLKSFLILVLLGVFYVLAQKKNCSTPEEESFEDLNSITKCTVDIKSNSKKNSKSSKSHIRVNVSASKKRFLKRRIENEKSLKSKGLVDVKSSKTSLKFKIASLSSNLSSKEVQSAEKFGDVDRIPTFKECTDVKKSNELKCFNNFMSKHIEKYFEYPNDAVFNKIEGEVWVRFIIDKHGNIANIKALGPDKGELLEKEAIRVVSHLPKLNSGVKKGKEVSVKYGFPINFNLSE